MTNDGWGKPTGWGNSPGANLQKEERIERDGWGTKYIDNVPIREVDKIIGDPAPLKEQFEIIKSMTGGGWYASELAPEGVEDEIELLIPSYDNETNERIEGEFVKALILKVGMLGIVVNREIDGRIFHIPTQTKFDRALPEREMGTRFSRKMLIDWCRCVQAEGPREAWVAVNALTHETHRQDAKAAIAGLLEYCRSVPMGE